MPCSRNFKCKHGGLLEQVAVDSRLCSAPKIFWATAHISTVAISYTTLPRIFVAYYWQQLPTRPSRCQFWNLCSGVSTLMKGTVTCMHQLDCKNSCKFAAETKEICVLIIRRNFICRKYAIKPPTVHGFKKLCNICLLAHLRAGRQKCKMYINHSTKKGLIPRAIM